MNHESRIPIIILHGWSKEMSGKKYKELKKILEEKGFTVYVPDLPGFGSEPLKKPIMILDDYVAFVKDFMEKKNIKKAIIIGHSFGGRIGAKLAYKNPHLVEKLILTGAPLIKKKLSLKKRVIAITAIAGKKIVGFLPDNLQNMLRKLFYFSIGEWDYYKAGELKETFKAIVNEDLSSILPKFTVATLIIWGEHDTLVPVSYGRKIVNAITNSKLVVVPNATHKLPYENPSLFAKEVLSFIS